MEEINSKKTEAFLTAIKTLADEECKSIDEETDRLRVERLRALQKEAEDRYKSYTEYETARIKADCNSAVSECEERSRKELTDLRAELCKKVYVIHRRNEFRGEQRLCEELRSFHNIEFLLNEYTKTDSYREKLVSSAKEIAEAFDGGDVELFLRKEDLVFSDDLKAIFKNGCVVTESDDIVYGGLRAADRKTHCLADDTLDTKLKEQKEWFLEHSGLSIEE